MSLSKPEVLALIYLPKWHLESEELNFAFEMLKKSLRGFCDIRVLHHPISNELILENLSQPIAYKQWLIVNSGCLLSNQWLQATQDFWQESKLNNPLIFSDFHDHVIQEPYFTLFGFDQFCSKLTKQFKHNTVPQDFVYNPRQVHALTVLTTDLKRLAAQKPDNLLTSLYAGATILRSIYTHCFDNYYSESREDNLSLIPENIGSLLDIGCGTGKFGKLIKDKLSIPVDGIELNHYQASLAAKQLNQVYTEDACQLELKNRYDFITCLDMIEHLSHPEHLLKKISSSWLKPGGQLLLSIPNIGHWSIIEELLAGEFNYVPAGLLCNTHIRFYTKKSMINLLQASGFQVVQIIPQKTPAPEKIVQAIDKLSSSFMIDQESLSTHGYKIVAIAQ